MGTTRITGRSAIAIAEQEGLTLAKYADPTEGARQGLTIDEAREIARIDEGLVYIDVDTTHRHAPTSTSTPRAFVAPVNQDPHPSPGCSYNPAAHGNVVVVESCACGLARVVAVNGHHREEGPWHDHAARVRVAEARAAARAEEQERVESAARSARYAEAGARHEAARAAFLADPAALAAHAENLRAAADGLRDPRRAAGLRREASRFERRAARALGLSGGQ